jgi:hypothetical protein
LFLNLGYLVLFDFCYKYCRISLNKYLEIVEVKHRFEPTSTSLVRQLEQCQKIPGSERTVELKVQTCGIIVLSVLQQKQLHYLINNVW